MIQLGLKEPSPSASSNASGSSSPDIHADAGRLAILKSHLQASIGERFAVLDPIAIGGMATLFQLAHKVHGGLFAAKVLHLEWSGREEIRESFRREAVHLAVLGDHPGTIPIYDCNLSSKPPFLVMPFVEGEDLDRMIARGPISRGETLHMAAQISSVLCHAESHGIAHCDLTPGNIRLDIFGRYRLLDFGLSWNVRETSQYRPRGGTPLYTSPEQIAGASPDHRSDLYSLGLILTEMLTGKPLIHGQSVEEIHRKHVASEWELPDAVEEDKALSRLLRRLLEVSPAERMQSAYELSGALAAMGFERPEFNQQATTASPSNQTKRRSRLLPS